MSTSPCGFVSAAPQQELLSVFLILAIPVYVKWYLMAVLICVVLVTNEVLLLSVSASEGCGVPRPGHDGN